MKNKQTPAQLAKHHQNIGANKAYNNMRRRIRRRMKSLPCCGGSYAELESLLVWINEHDVRNRKKGGLGRK